MWAQRIRLWSALLVCGVIAVIGCACWLICSYVKDLWRDVAYWRRRRRNYHQQRKVTR